MPAAANGQTYPLKSLGEAAPKRLEAPACRTVLAPLNDAAR